MRSFWSKMALSFGILICAVPARAQNEANRSQARELSNDGFDALDRGDWKHAETSFQRAESLYHAPTILVGLARAQSHLGKYVEAWEAYHRVILEGVPAGATPLLVKAVDDARAEIDEVAGKRSKVTLSVAAGDNPTVTLDGVVIPRVVLGLERPVNPGVHTVHAEASGFISRDGTFTVDEGKSTAFSLSLTKVKVEDMPRSPSSPAHAAMKDGVPAGGSSTRTLAFVSLGVGAAGIVTGAIAGALALGKHADLVSNPCSSAPCNAVDGKTYDSERDTFHSMGTIATLGFVAGAAFGAAGAVLLLTAPKKEPRVGSFIAPTIGVGTVGAAGAF